MGSIYVEHWEYEGEEEVLVRRYALEELVSYALEAEGSCPLDASAVLVVIQEQRELEASEDGS